MGRCDEGDNVGSKRREEKTGQKGTKKKDKTSMRKRIGAVHSSVGMREPEEWWLSGRVYNAASRHLMLFVYLRLPYNEGTGMEEGQDEADVAHLIDS